MKENPDDVIYILKAMINRDYKPRINAHTGNDLNDMARAALDYAIEAIEELKILKEVKG